MKRKIIWSFCIAGLPLLPAICKNKSTNEKCRNHTRGSMERHRRQSHQRPWRRLLYHEGTYYWYGEYKKGETNPARMGYVGMLPHRRNRCQLLLFERPAELEVRGYCTSCRERRRETRPAPQQGAGTSQSDLQREDKEIRHVGACGKC